eukprot:1925598-Pyramimonas_sp.AAC.1
MREADLEAQLHLLSDTYTKTVSAACDLDGWDPAVQMPVEHQVDSPHAGVNAHSRTRPTLLMPTTWA